MTYCEDFPCCGHEAGCCPDFDSSGQQLNMICVCGTRLPVNNPSSCCDHCLQDLEDPDYSDFPYNQPDEEELDSYPDDYPDEFYDNHEPDYDYPEDF
jgi:hypothetical protein